MADQLADSFLDSYFKTITMGQQQKQFQAEQAFKQQQLAQQGQIEGARLKQENQYNAGRLGLEGKRVDQEAEQFRQRQSAEQAEKAFSLQAQGLGTPVQPNFQSAGPGVGLQAPGGMPQIPGLTAPAQLEGAQPPTPTMQATPTAPPGATQFGQTFLQPTDPLARTAQANKAKADSFMQAMQGVQLSPVEQHRVALAHAAILSGQDSDAIVKSIFPEAHDGPEADRPLGIDRVTQLNQGITQQYGVMFPGKPVPPSLLLTPTATVGDYNRLDGQVKNITAATGVQAQRDATNALANTRLDEQKKDAAIKIYAPAVASAERFNIMTQNFEDAVKNHDQQAMLSLLSNHLGMTLGLQKGARITQVMLNEAQKSAPWLSTIGAKFDKDGFLSGVTLTQPQMRDMVALAQHRYSEDYKAADSNGVYKGIKDGGPRREPGEATIRFYKQQAGGDKAKAKALAAKDGWSVD